VRRCLPARRTAPVVLLLVLVASVSFAKTPVDADGVHWTADRDDRGDILRARFSVDDGPCAYRAIADPAVMEETIEHLEGVEVHSERGADQELTLSERFVLVGLVQSRYRRTVDGSSLVTWHLLEGRQKRHDGTWRVDVRADGRADVDFENVIAAKYRIHQPLLRRIQDQTMSDIVSAVRGACSP